MEAAPTTYLEAALVEKHLENFIAEHPDILFPYEEETFHIIATQVSNAFNDTVDIIGLLATGELVVVEVKRDKADMSARTEPLEWQAFRYAATLATIKSPEELVPLFASHIEKYKHRYGNPPDSLKKARELLDEYLADMDPDRSFNDHQQIILVASDFDKQTLAACSWLILNDVPLQCIRITPHPSSTTEVILDVARMLPLSTIEELLPSIGSRDKSFSKPRATGVRGPGLPELLTAGLLQVGDELYVKKAPTRTARLIDAETVEFEGTQMSPSKWGTEVTGWPTISVYQSVYLKRTTKNIKALRALLPVSPQTQPAEGSAKGG